MKFRIEIALRGTGTITFDATMEELAHYLRSSESPMDEDIDYIHALSLKGDES